MKKNENDKIIRMYENINTPEYDVKDKVLSEISKTKRVPRLNRKVMLAAVLIMTFLLLGSAAATGILHNLIAVRQTEPLYTPEVEPTPTATPVPPNGINMNEDYKNNPDYIMSQFCIKAEGNEYRIAYRFYSSDGSACASEAVSRGVCSSYEEMKMYFEDDNLALPFPEYIPDEYEFDSGEVRLYVDERMMDIEPDSEWTEDGITYVIFTLPDDYKKNVSYYHLHFKNAEGESLSFYVDSYPLDCYGDTHEITASQTDLDEYVNVRGFGEALLIYEQEQNRYKLAMLKETQQDDAFLFFALRYNELIDDESWEEEYIETLGQITVVIYADGLSKEEIIKFAEGME